MQTISFRDVIDQDLVAVEISRSTLAGVPDLNGATPCGAWTVHDLVDHMSAQHRGFARAADGIHSQAEEWESCPSIDPVRDYGLACGVVIDAFARLTDPQLPLDLPLIATNPFPAMQAVSFHLVDTVVHAWDLAVSGGAAVQFPDDVLAGASAVARLVPDGPERGRPGAAFAPAREVPRGAEPLTEILLLLGRDPGWVAR